MNIGLFLLWLAIGILNFIDWNNQDIKSWKTQWVFTWIVLMIQFLEKLVEEI